jgi:hypothetical protein
MSSGPGIQWLKKSSNTEKIAHRKSGDYKQKKGKNDDDRKEKFTIHEK